MSVSLKMLCRAGALCLPLILSACAGPEIIRGESRAALVPVDKASLRVAVSAHHPHMLVSKFERGLLSQPVTTDDERRLAHTRAEALELQLAHDLVPALQSRLRPYVGTAGPRQFVLLLEIDRIVVATDGAADVQVTATLSDPGARQQWLRTIRVSMSRFGNGGALGQECADAIVAQLKASALLG